MKVIFIKDLKGQGKTNETKEVKDGYAQNFLIKNGYAVKANDTNVYKINKDLSEKKLETNLLIKDMEVLKKELEKKEFVFKAKTGKQDMMFGSISSKQIKEILIENGYKIDKTQIKIDHPLTGLGTHNVNIELHKEVIATIKINIVK